MITIMRGAQGFGKSHYIKNNLPEETIVCSADHFFMKNGDYLFDPKQISKAHEECLKKYTLLVASNYSGHIAVDNTNIRLWEISPYVNLATAFGLDYKIVEIVANPTIAAARNIHGVPEKTVIQAYKNLEEPLPWWNYELYQN